jgi:Xaa-Pro dipeptidase
LPAGSIITVEPGVSPNASVCWWRWLTSLQIYFCRFIVEPYLQDPVHSQYINFEVLNKYWCVGGVRIEDNILITKTGYENLTTAIKDVAEMEKIINGA